MQDIRQHETVRYFVSPGGRLVPAPDNHLTAKQCGFVGWRTFDAKGAREIETLSICLARQAFEDKKQMTADQMLREKAFRDRLRASARIRVAQAYSEADVAANRRMIERMDQQDRIMEAAICAQFDETSRTAMFEMEYQEASPPTKHEGIA